jgi:hypothetical protein
MQYEITNTTDHTKKANAGIPHLLIILLMLIGMAVTGLMSYQLFRVSDYNVSALLTISSYFSIVLGIYALSMGKTPKITG